MKRTLAATIIIPSLAFGNAVIAEERFNERYNLWMVNSVCQKLQKEASFMLDSSDKAFCSKSLSTMRYAFAYPGDTPDKTKQRMHLWLIIHKEKIKTLMDGIKAMEFEMLYTVFKRLRQAVD